MASIGLDVSRDPVFPDIAFSLPAPPNTASGEPPLTFGVGVMAYYGWKQDPVRGREAYDAYIAKMTAYIQWLVAQGHRVRILMGDEQDSRTAEDILGALRSDNPDRLDDFVEFAPAYSIHDVMHQMADTDVVVATRYHNIVCALRMGKPTISIGYADKNDVLMSEMGLAEFCQHIERLDVERLKTHTLRLLSDRAARERNVHEVLAHFESKLREQESLLTPLICSPSR
jgi:polysaccharide pyruvyl transferase WcaK-like protein